MNIKEILLAAVAISAFATSCSNIDENERYIYVKPADVGRAVLIEDFTGQKCSNCPHATEVIEALQEEYGADNVIAVGIHSGPLGFKGTAKSLGLMTDTGQEYYDSHNIPSQPYLVVNRRQESATADNLGTLVYNEIQETATLSMELANKYDAATGTATIDVGIVGFDDIKGKLQVWVIEDGITAMQTIENGSTNKEYVHNHVFRSAVNGTWGEDVSISNGATVTAQYTLSLDEKWIAENVSIVAFVYNDNGVLQAVKAPLVDELAE